MYSTQLYEPEHKQGVASLLTDLWGGNMSENIKKFEAKYENNPYDERIYAVVTLHDNDVVGFRGFIPTKWLLKNKEIGFLLVADANVHKEHRRKGLFSRMNKKALEAFKDSGYCGYLNLSSNRFSSPGYLKLGWKPFARKDLYRFTSLFSLLSWKLGLPTFVFGKNKNIKIISDFNDSEVSNTPLVRKSDPEKIAIADKEKFYAYKNLRNSYSCFQLFDKDELKAYATVSESNGGCTIYDFEYEDVPSFKKVLRELRKYYHVVSVWDFSLKDIPIRRSFLSTQLEKLESKNRTDFLFRPILREPTPEDFTINGQNFLSPEIWNLKQLYSE